MIKPKTSKDFKGCLCLTMGPDDILHIGDNIFLRAYKASSNRTRVDIVAAKDIKIERQRGQKT